MTPAGYKINRRFHYFRAVPGLFPSPSFVPGGALSPGFSGGKTESGSLYTLHSAKAPAFYHESRFPGFYELVFLGGGRFFPFAVRAQWYPRAVCTPRPFHKSVSPPLQALALPAGILSSANVLDENIISSINALVKYFWNFFC